MVYRNADTDADELGRVVGTLLGVELVRIAAEGSPSSELFSLVRRDGAEFSIDPVHDLGHGERACLATGVRAAAFVRIDDEEIIMLVSLGGASTWDAEYVFGYFADEDEGIETSLFRVEGDPSAWRDVVIAAIERQFANYSIRVGARGDYFDPYAPGDDPTLD